MRAEEQAREKKVSLKRAFAVSSSSAFFAGVGGFAAFFVIAFSVAPGSGEDPVVDQGFFLVCMNLVPLALIIAVASLVALLLPVPGKAVAVAMAGLLMVVGGGLAYLFVRYADVSSKFDQIYVLGALVPGITAILINWFCVNQRLKRLITMDKLGNPV